MATVTLSVKNVPKEVAKRLKSRAARNHRSLQGERLAILSEAGEVTTIAELAAFAKRMGLRHPSESAAMLRDDRDGHRR